MKKGIWVAVAFTAVWGALSTAFAQETARLRTGTDSSVDGYLEVNPDVYGSWTNSGLPGNEDFYNPQGPLGVNNYSFFAHLMIYDPVLQDRLALGSPDGDIDFTYNFRGLAPATLRYRELTGFTVSDSSENGVDDTATSSFWIFGTTDSGNPDLRVQFDLEQRVAGPDQNGISTFTKTYHVTNLDDVNAVSFTMQQHDDFDLLFDFFARDAAGADSVGGFRNPYMREPDEFAGNLATKVALSGSAGGVYTAGRSGFDPDGPGGPDPEYGAGTDFQEWDMFQMPTSWENNVAGIGHNVDGILGQAMPPGGGDPNDALMDLQWDLVLDGGCTVTVIIMHTYGASTPTNPITEEPSCLPSGCDQPCDMNCDGAINAFDIEPFLGLLFDGDDPCCGTRGDVGSTGDTNGDGAINPFDIEPFPACLFP